MPLDDALGGSSRSQAGHDSGKAVNGRPPNLVAPPSTRCRSHIVGAQEVLAGLGGHFDHGGRSQDASAVRRLPAVCGAAPRVRG